MVLFDRTNHQLETHKIGVRHEREIAMAATQLLKQGCKNILLLCCKGIGANDARIAGIWSALITPCITLFFWI